MNEHLLIGLTTIVVLGVGATWLAWRLRLPSILLLLLAGFIAGPITGFLNPDEILGDLLFPFVSFSVALILYEGGLTLNFSEIRKESHVVFRLITIGVLVTWAIGTIAAHTFLGLNLGMALLLSSILVVTGPTVVGPLLQQVRPKGRVGPTLKWEGILIDPVGALLAVLVFEIILEGELHQAPLLIAQGVFLKMLVGVIFGLLAAGLLLFLLKRFWIPDFLHNGVSVMVVLLAFTTANLLQEESGLVSVTLMGLVLANQKLVPVKHIVEFKENLRVMLIATLFILLAARLSLDDLASIGPAAFLFLAVLVFVARPLSVFLGTLFSKLNIRERLLMSWMAPRGIVAAAIASIFSFRLLEAGHEGAETLVPLTFLVIIGTVLLYGLTAKPFARFLNLADEDPQGLILMGAHPLGRAMAQTLQEEGISTVLVDSNWQNISKARMDGLTTYYGSATSEDALEEIDFTGIGRFLALTPNEEANALAALHFAEIFSRAEVYQLATEGEKQANGRKKAPLHLNGRYLFDPEITYTNLSERLQTGDVIKATNITNNFDMADFRSTHPHAVPFFLMKSDGTLHIYSQDETLTPEPNDLLISLTRQPTTEKQQTAVMLKANGRSP
jgi:NhaP-type Na+/H+ or K+/H+ antiporter